MRVRRKLVCCSKDRDMSIDFDNHQYHPPPKIMTYEGLESCILNSPTYGNESGSSSIEEDHGCAADSLEEDDATSCSSSNVVGSYASRWTVKDERENDTWNDSDQSPLHLYANHKPACLTQFSDVESMKDKFAKLILGEDVTGGSKGISPAHALSNAITNLAASIFGELWKLEPLPEEAKNRWQKEMDWLVSPTNYMVELVPAKQCVSNGHIFEIMTPKARADVHMNLPALQKLDSMLIEALDSMVKMEFWYTEGSNHREEKEGMVRQSKRWWLPYPRVPIRGLSEKARKGLITQGNVMHQVFKAAKLINQNVLSEMPIPSAIKAALLKTGRANLGEDLYTMLTNESSSASEIADSLKLKSDHKALDTINKLEAAQLVWQERLQEQEINGKPHVRKSWPYTKDPVSEADRIGYLMFKAEILMQQLRTRFPYLPHSFLDSTKIQYGQDIGHAIMEAYSRVLANLAYNILLRIGDILQEDHTSNPTLPVPMASVPGLLSPKWMLSAESSPAGVNQRARRSLEDRMSSRAESCYFSDSNPSRRSSDLEVSPSEARTSSVMATPSVSRIWCIGSDACGHGSPYKTP